MSGQNKLEQLIERHGMYSEAEAMGKALRSEDTNARESARGILRNYHAEKNGVELPADQPMSGEFYDWTVLGIQAESGRDEYWNTEKEKCLSELSSKVLEENVLEITPIKLEEGKGKIEKHNEAYDLHSSFYALASICESYDAGKIGKDELYKVAGSEIVNGVEKRLADDDYLNEKDKALVMRSALSTLRIGDVARSVTGTMAEKKGKEFLEYFENSKGYSAGDYAKENLIYNKNIDESIGQVAELYAESTK